MKVELRFGVMAPPIRKQLRQQGVHLLRFTVAQIEQCEKDADALSRLTLRGLISEKVRDAGRRKVMLAVLKCCASPVESP